MTAPVYPAAWKNLNAALVHDWLTGMRGGEKVLELLADGFPNATITSMIHKPQAVSNRINAHPVRTSVLQHVPGIFELYRYFLPLFPLVVKSMHPPEADIQISTSHCLAKSVRPAKGTPHLCYCFTPMRYAWLFHDEYFGSNPIKRIFLSPFLRFLQMWDKKKAAQVDRFIAISKHVQKRILDCYGIRADLIYPPIDTDFYTPAHQPSKEYDLIVSALVPYKKVDLAIQAYANTDRKLKIAGIGTERGRWEAMATDNIEFLGWQSDEAIRELYQNCRYLVFPGEEDFGLVPLEAQACGRPVIAYRKGGALETVQENVSGIFFEEQTPESLWSAVKNSGDMQWDSTAIRTHAEHFGIQRFLDEMGRAVENCIQQRALKN